MGGRGAGSGLNRRNGGGNLAPATPDEEAEALSSWNGRFMKFDSYEMRRADEYHRLNNFTDEVVKLNSTELRAIQEYTGSSYEEMNDHLRGIQKADSWTVDTINQATAGLEKTEIKEDVVLYRGMGGMQALSAWTGIPVSELMTHGGADKLVGQTITEHAFMSTGITEGNAWYGVQLTVYARKGTEAMYVDPISFNQGERELLLNRGQRFYIKQIDYDAFGQVHNIHLITLKRQRRRKDVK